MQKKNMISIFVCMMLIAVSFSSVTGLNQRIFTIENNQMKYSSFNSGIVTMINTINYSILFEYLENIVSFGVRHVGSENYRNAAEYINEEFQSLGLDSYIDEWRYPRYKCQNVVATYNGCNPNSDAIFVLTAHLDTIGDSVGANDDGSGVATLLTIANIASEYQFNHTIKFVIVSGEEVGLFGSFDYAQKAYGRNENIIANINVDTIGNSTCGRTIIVQKPERSNWLFEYAKEVNQKYDEFIDMKIQLEQYFPVDGQSFVDYGYDTISFVQPKVIEYPYHTPQDTLDKIDYPYYENVTKLILALTAELAHNEINLQVRLVTPMEGYVYLLNRPVLKTPGFNVIRSGLRGTTYLMGRTMARINITTDEEILSVSYSIDGILNFFGVFTEPPYDWKIQKNPVSIFRIKRVHKVGVRVNTINGNTAYDEMDFYALTRI